MRLTLALSAAFLLVGSSHSFAETQKSTVASKPPVPPTVSSNVVSPPPPPPAAPPAPPSDAVAPTYVPPVKPASEEEKKEASKVFSKEACKDVAGMTIGWTPLSAAPPLSEREWKDVSEHFMETNDHGVASGIQLETLTRERSLPSRVYYTAYKHKKFPEGCQVSYYPKRMSDDLLLKLVTMYSKAFKQEPKHKYLEYLHAIYEDSPEDYPKTGAYIQNDMLPGLVSYLWQSDELNDRVITILHILERNHFAINEPINFFKYKHTHTNNYYPRISNYHQQKMIMLSAKYGNLSEETLRDMAQLFAKHYLELSINKAPTPPPPDSFDTQFDVLEAIDALAGQLTSAQKKFFGAVLQEQGVVLGGNPSPIKYPNIVAALQALYH